MIVRASARGAKDGVEFLCANALETYGLTEFACIFAVFSHEKLVAAFRTVLHLCDARIKGIHAVTTHSLSRSLSIHQVLSLVDEE